MAEEKKTSPKAEKKADKPAKSTKSKAVTVTYTGALSEVDPFEGTIVSVEKVK